VRSRQIRLRKVARFQAAIDRAIAASYPNDPWIANMGIFQDDPTFDDFLAEVNTYRNAIDTINLRFDGCQGNK
jgi:hypothetical protein